LQEFLQRTPHGSDWPRSPGFQSRRDWIDWQVILSSMAHDDAERFRKQAEQAREHAARAYSPLDKEAWLRVAEEWT